MFSSIQIIMVGFAFDRGWSYPGPLTQTSKALHALEEVLKIQNRACTFISIISYNLMVVIWSPDSGPRGKLVK